MMKLLEIQNNERLRSNVTKIWTIYVALLIFDLFKDLKKMKLKEVS